MQNYISYEKAVEDLEAHPEKRIFWRSGWAWKGAVEREIRRDHKWKDDLKAKYDWACVVDLDSNDDGEMHLNGLSENDMY